jgi:CspA family cold shock protein
MTTGKVRMFNADRGFGFIAPDAGGDDVFVHITRCADGLDELQPGTRVEFNERESPRKPGSFEAVDVRVI